MTTGTQGSQVTWSSTYNTPPSPGASSAPCPMGKRAYKTWTGGDSANNGVITQVILKPAQTAIVVKRRRDGSEYYKEVVVSRKRYVRKRIRIAPRTPNAFSKTWSSGTRNIGRIYFGHKPCQPSGMWQLIVDPYIPSMPSLASIFTANDELRIITKMQKRVNDTDFDPSVFLGTINQSFATIADRTVRIAKSIAYIKKGNWARAREAVYGHKSGRTSVKKSTAQNVLEIQYGWRPLVDDVHEAAIWVAALLNKPRMQRVSQRLQRIGEVNLLPAARHSFASQELLVRKQIIAYLKEEKQDVSLNAWSPANLAWELLPWSFVIDWFIPIGEYLQARGVASQLKGTFVITTKYEKRLWGNHYGGSYGTCDEVTAVHDYAGLTPTWTEGQMERTISTTLNVELPELKPLAKAASFEHCLNAVALLLSSRDEKPDQTLRKIGRLK